ncbi:MAG: hypothetical protein OEM62_02480 [Acidobacteriota bacterium]|nr:hypothetical protein [Acidobacteriota bacterium]
MRHSPARTTLILVLAAGLAAGARAGETDAFEDAMSHYEAIRIELLNDSTDGIDEHARGMEERIATLAEDLTYEEAGVPESVLAELDELLPELAVAVGELAEAGDLEQAREALFALSKPLGRYRKLAGIDGTVVAYCPMAQKAWIQREGELGNPYMGQAMPRCGRVIED